MSSVQDEEKCPQCGGCYTTDFDCRTFEEFKFCHRCGKREEYKLIRNEQGKAILDKDGQPKYIEESRFGFGCLMLAGKKGVSALYSMPEPLTDGMINDIKKTLEEDDVDADKSYLTKWDDEKHDVVAVFGTVPKLYDESFEDEDEPDKEQKTEGE